MKKKFTDPTSMKIEVDASLPICEQLNEGRIQLDKLFPMDRRRVSSAAQKEIVPALVSNHLEGKTRVLVYRTQERIFKEESGPRGPKPRKPKLKDGH